MNKVLQRKFYEQSTMEAAKNLLGCYLVHESNEGKTVGKIVETEAYLKDDPGSHAFSGKTNRNKAMFGEAGRAYVYFIYGMYHCFNVVTNKKGIGEAVLIRALEPIEGIELMKRRREIKDVKKLCNGPAKLVISMGIKKKYNESDLTKKPLYITMGEKVEDEKIVAAKRIGLACGEKLPYRFYIKENGFVSIT